MRMLFQQAQVRRIKAKPETHTFPCLLSSSMSSALRAWLASFLAFRVGAGHWWCAHRMLAHGQFSVCCPFEGVGWLPPATLPLHWPQRRSMLLSVSHLSTSWLLSFSISSTLGASWRGILAEAGQGGVFEWDCGERGGERGARRGGVRVAQRSRRRRRCATGVRMHAREPMRMRARRHSLRDPLEAAAVGCQLPHAAPRRADQWRGAHVRLADSHGAAGRAGVTEATFGRQRRRGGGGRGGGRIGGRGASRLRFPTHSFSLMSTILFFSPFSSSTA